MFCKKDVLKNVAKFTGKHLCQSLFKRVSLFCKPVLSPGPPFLITYSSTSNWKLCFSFCIIINSFPFTPIDTAIIRSSRSVVFFKKDVLTNFEQFAREHLCQNLVFKLQTTEFNFVKKEIPAQIFFCEFRAKFLINPSDGCFTINTSFVYGRNTIFHLSKNDVTPIFRLSIFSA